MMLGTIEYYVRTIGDRTIDAHPSLKRPALRVWYHYVHAHVRAVAWKNSLTHEAPIRPFEIVWVDTDRIEEILPPFTGSKFKYACRVMSGEWDRRGEPFEETDVYRAFEAHFQRGVDWRETAFFHRVVDQIESGHELWGCRSRRAFEERCERLDALYAKIDDEGFKTQRELHDGSGDEVVEKGRSSATERIVQDEMTISVGRQGELLFNDGRDRLAIAKVLDVDEIPAWILVRHEQWQAVRDAVASGELDLRGLPAQIQDHPDLSATDRRR